MSPLYLLLPNPVQTNQLGTGFGSQGLLVGIVPTVTPLGELLALHISARDIWAHIQICLAYENATNHNFLPNNANLFCVVNNAQQTTASFPTMTTLQLTSQQLMLQQYKPPSN